MAARVLLLLLALVSAGCTPGAAGAGGAASGVTGTQTIDVNLTKNPAGTTPAGTGAGYSPLAVVVPVGTMVRFVNSDGFAHTATAIAATTFPSAYPFTGSALTQSGATLSGSWSSGALNAGSGSQLLLADRAGTYIFGCFFHYGSPMRGAIVVQ